MTSKSSRAVQSLVRHANIEVIPLRGADDKATSIPAGTTITITCSPKFGLERTVEHVARARSTGHRVVPHLAGRMVEDEAELQRFLFQIDELGVDDLFVIGGDGEKPVGKFDAALDVIESIQHLDHGLARIGIGCYPEGHPNIPDTALLDTLKRKQQYADYMVSQLCFDASTFIEWLKRVRAEGITMPIRIGVASPLQTRKLVELSMKIGVGSSVNFLTKQHGFIGNLLLGRSYAPDRLIRTIVEDDAFEDLNIEGLHMFSFNQIDATTEWQQRIADSVAIP